MDLRPSGLQDVYGVCMRTIYASGSFSYVSGELESALERHDRRSRSGSTTRVASGAQGSNFGPLQETRTNIVIEVR